MDGLDIVKDIIHPERNPAALQEREFFGQTATIIEIDEQPQVERGEVGKAQVGAGQSAIDPGCCLMLAVDAEAED